MNYKLISRVLVINNKNEILILKRSVNGSNPNKYELPGGKINQGEQPIDAAVRELAEETGVFTKKENLRIVYLFCSDPEDGVTWCDVIYKLNLSKAPEVILSEEHVSAVFVSQSDIFDYDMVPDQLKIIQSLASSLTSN